MSKDRHAIAQNPGVEDIVRDQDKYGRLTQKHNDRAMALAKYKQQYVDAIRAGVPQGALHPPSNDMDLVAANQRLNFHLNGRGNAAPSTGPIDTVTKNPPASHDAVTTVTNPDGSKGTMSGHASQPPARSEAPQTRRTPTGGTETLVQSQSGPRWVASTDRVPPITGAPMERQPQQMQPVDQKALIDGAHTYEEKLAVNRRLAAPGGMMEPVPTQRGPLDSAADPNVVAKAGTGQNAADPRYGTASSTDVLNKQIANRSPAGGRGSNPIPPGFAVSESPGAPPTAASNPADPLSAITSNPSGRPDGPVPVPTVPAAYAAGKAIRSVPNAIGNVVGSLGDSAMTAANSATTGVRNIFRGITGAPPVAAGESAPMKDPTDLRTPPGMGPARQLPDIAKSFFSPSVAGSAGNAVRTPPVVPYKSTTGEFVRDIIKDPSQAISDIGSIISGQTGNGAMLKTGQSQIAPVAPVPPLNRIAAQTAGGSSPNRNDYMNHGTLTPSPTPVAPPASEDEEAKKRRLANTQGPLSNL